LENWRAVARDGNTAPREIMTAGGSSHWMMGRSDSCDTPITQPTDNHNLFNEVM
jgi:hypothetical protein